MKKVLSSLSVVAALAISGSAVEPINNVVVQPSVAEPVKVKEEPMLSFSWFKSYSTSSKLTTTTTLQDAVARIAEDLAVGFDKCAIGDKSIAVTSFVDLHKLNKTTNFGRTLGESFFNELFKKNFNVMDLRIQKEFSVNANGEYFISRDVKRLNESVEADFALVGTYVQVEEGVLINARIISTTTGKVVATSRVIYGDKSCEIFENCKPVVTPEKVVEVVEKVVYVEKEKPVAKKIKITTDGCSAVDCPLSN